MRKWMIGFAERLLRWRMAGRALVVHQFGQVIWSGTIMATQIDAENGEIVITAFHATDGVIPFDLGCGHAPVVRFPLTETLIWNASRKQYEADAHVLDPGTRRQAARAMGGGSYRPGDRQEAGEEPEHGQGSPQAFVAATATHGRPYGEGPSGLPSRHHVPAADKSTTDGADDPGEDSDAGGEGLAGTLTLTLAVQADGFLPDGILVAVTPDQELLIYRLDQNPPAMPDNTVIWANAFTAEQYRQWTYRVHGEPDIQ